MRIMALILASALAVCFMNPASATTKRSSELANPDRPVYRSSETAIDQFIPILAVAPHIAN